MKPESHDLAAALVMAPRRTRTNLRIWIARTNRVLPLLIALPLFTCSAALLTYVAWKTPMWFSAVRTITDVKDRVTLENEILKNLSEVVGGAFLLAGLYFT